MQLSRVAFAQCHGHARRCYDDLFKDVVGKHRRCCGGYGQSQQDSGTATGLATPRSAGAQVNIDHVVSSMPCKSAIEGGDQGNRRGVALRCRQILQPSMKPSAPSFVLRTTCCRGRYRARCMRGMRPTVAGAAQEWRGAREPDSLFIRRACWHGRQPWAAVRVGPCPGVVKLVVMIFEVGYAPWSVGRRPG